MSHMSSNSTRRVRSGPGQALAWLAIGLLLLQMWGGPAFLMRLVAAEDSFTLLSLQYLCTGLPGDDAAVDVAGRVAGNDGIPVNDRKPVDHIHCLLCPDHVAPFLPIAAPALIRAMAWAWVAAIDLRTVFLVRYNWNVSRSRAPPMTVPGAMA
jgi:hypothetical protein